MTGAGLSSGNLAGDGTRMGIMSSHTLRQKILFAAFAASTCVQLACESTSAPSTPSPSANTSGKTSNKKGDDPNAPAGEFDLCGDGLVITERLKPFAFYVNSLCGKSQLATLRSPDNIYGGGDNKIIENSKALGDRSSSFTLMTSAVYQTTVENYWALLRLQFLKPKIYGENFEHDADAKVTEVEPSSDDESVTFRYQNSTGEGGLVDYYAKTELIELEGGQAYVTATKLTQTKETITDLKGLIIVNRIDDASIEVFSTSFQEYGHQAGQGETFYSRATTAVKAEQKRVWKNARDAEKAKDLLDE